jgi:hypothetical protein
MLSNSSAQLANSKCALSFFILNLIQQSTTTADSPPNCGSKSTQHIHNHRVCLSTSVKKQVLFWTDESIWMCYSNLLLRLPLATNKNKPIAKINFIFPRRVQSMKMYPACC